MDSVLQAAPTTGESGFAIVALLFSFLLLAAVVVVVIAAVVSIVRAPIEGKMKLLWIVLVFLTPLIGALIWFLVGRRMSKDTAAPGPR